MSHFYYSHNLSIYLPFNDVLFSAFNKIVDSVGGGGGQEHHHASWV